MLTMHSMNNVVSSCVDCHFWKSVNSKNKLDSLSSHLLKLRQHIVSNYSNLRCMERLRATVFRHCQYKNQHEYMTERILEFPDGNKDVYICFWVPSIVCIRSESLRGQHEVAAWHTYYFCFDCMSCFEPANVCNTYMCVLFWQYVWVLSGSFSSRVQSTAFFIGEFVT